MFKMCFSHDTSPSLRENYQNLIICQFCIQNRDFQGNSLVLHCASLLRTIFGSLARAHEHVHVQNERDFPQTKLDSEINAPFPLNEHGDPRFFSGIC